VPLRGRIVYHPALAVLAAREVVVRWWALIGIGVVLGVGCDGHPGSSEQAPEATDARRDAYTGTWERTAGSPSRISLRPAGDGYAFRWRLEQGARRVECERDNVCFEYSGENKIYEWTFRTLRGADGQPRIERDGRPIDPTTTPLKELDRLELQPGGTELWVFTIERNGEVLDTPTGPYKFRKVSDEPL
jgi:hypothetical protein